MRIISTEQRRHVVPPPEQHASGRKIRDDALPEHMRYQDDGCELSPSCIRCPLAVCRYDQPGGARRLVRNLRQHDLRRLADDGVPVDTLAAQFGMTRRSVYRVLARRG
jgi:hypothetical protein